MTLEAINNLFFWVKQDTLVNIHTNLYGKRICITIKILIFKKAQIVLGTRYVSFYWVLTVLKKELLKKYSINFVFMRNYKY